VVSYLDGGPNGGVGTPVNLAAYTYAANNPVRLGDPDGRWVTIAIGAALGATISTGIEGYQQYRNGEFSARRLVGAAAGGAVTGAIDGATLGASFLVQGQVSGVASAVGGSVTRGINGEAQSLDTVSADYQSGVVGHGVGTAAAKVGGKVYSSVKSRFFGKSESAGAAAETAAGRITCANSFSGDTLVLKADGSRARIADLEPGDRVLATDPVTGETSVRTVTKRHVNRDTELTDLTVRDGDGRLRVIHTTQEHLFWDETRKAWVVAEDLRPGERLHSPDGTVVTVVVAASFGGARDMVNLTVDTVHTYYVLAGATPVLVHNANCGGLIPYNSDELSYAAFSARKGFGFPNGPGATSPGGNIAVARVEGYDKLIIGRSKSEMDMHSEDHIIEQINELRAKGYNIGNITQLFSERQPCSACAAKLPGYLSKDAAVTWAVPWGDDATINAASRDLLLRYIRRAAGGS
jgi:hypothetical protein